MAEDRLQHPLRHALVDSEPSRRRLACAVLPAAVLPSARYRLFRRLSKSPLDVVERSARNLAGKNVFVLSRQGRQLGGQVLADWNATDRRTGFGRPVTVGTELNPFLFEIDPIPSKIERCRRVYGSLLRH